VENLGSLGSALLSRRVTASSSATAPVLQTKMQVCAPPSAYRTHPSHPTVLRLTWCARSPPALLLALLIEFFLHWPQSCWHKGALSYTPPLVVGEGGHPCTWIPQAGGVDPG